MADDTLDFNPMSAEFAADPYPIYKQLREHDEPYHWQELDMVMLSRYSDVSQIALDKNMVRSLAGFREPSLIEQQKRKDNFHDMPYHERFVQKNLLDSDGPEHDRLRKLVFGAFTSAAVKPLQQTIQLYVDSLLGALPRGETIDFVETCAAPFPGLVIGRFLGVPESDAPQLKLWSEQVVEYFDINRTAEKKAIAEAATKDFHDYLTDLKAARISAPQDDLLSKMITQEADGLYAPDEIIATCMLILMAGHGSTIDVLGTGLHTLLNHPEALATLRQVPELMPIAIQEMFRFEPPLPFFHRHATQDVSIGEHHYRAGTTFGLLYAAANRDKAAFKNPDDFDIGRQANRHLAFGRGAHLCLGNHLARLNMQTMLTTLLSRFENIEAASDSVEFKRGLSIRGLKTLPMRLR